jgi:DnaJ family protein C protein 1
VHRLNHKKEVERVQKFMLLARKAAWGPKLVKNDAPRKVRVNIAGNPYIDGEEQEYVQGRMIDMLVHGDKVYLVSTSLPKPPSGAHPTATGQVAGHRYHIRCAC